MISRIEFNVILCNFIYQINASVVEVNNYIIIIFNVPNNIKNKILVPKTLVPKLTA